MSAVRLIAWRFMLKGTEKGRFSSMTLFAWLAIGVGVGTMSSLLSVMYGLESSLRENVLRAYPHIIVRQVGGASAKIDEAAFTKKFQALSGVERVAPFVETEMIAQSSRPMGVVVWGVPDSEWPRIQENLQEGTLPSKTSPVIQAVLGGELCGHLRLHNGSKFQLISPIRRQGALGSVPQSHTVEVSGLYTSGHYEFDKQYVFLPMADVQDFLGKGDVISGWHVWTHSMDEAEAVAQKISRTLPEGWKAQSWMSFNAALFRALKLEQLSMFLILSFAVLIAVMNISITLMMHVSHKRKNIGVLRALGASAQQIREIFIWQGAFLGMIGMLIGALLSAALIIYIQYFYEFPAVYYQRSAPVEVRPLAIGLVYLIATVLIFIATIYPAIRASELDPIEAIRE